MKKIIQRNLPLDIKYSLVSVTRQSLEDGTGMYCENCGRNIVNFAELESSLGRHTVGLDCLDTILKHSIILKPNDYFEYEYGAKSAIQKAKGLRIKLTKSKDVIAKMEVFKDSYGFSFTKNGRSAGFDYTFNPKYKDITIKYLSGLDNAITIE